MKKGYFMAFIMVFALTLGIGLTEAQAGPDLVVSDLIVQDDTAAGVNIFITDVTTNQGTCKPLPCKASATITNYFLSKNTTLDDTDIRLGSKYQRYVPALPKKQSNTGSNYVLIPKNVEGGNWYIIAKADALNYVRERVRVDGIVENRENNNTKYKSISILEAPTHGKRPDLIITAVNAPASADPGDVISISDTTKNAGLSVAYKTLTSFYLSADQTLGPGDLLIGGRIVASLGVNENQSGTTLVTIPVSASGTYYIIAVADDTSIMAETDENNNTMSSGAITIGP